MSIRFCGCCGPPSRGEAGPRYDDAFDLVHPDVALARRLGGGLGEGMVRVTARHQFHGHVVEDVPILPRWHAELGDVEPTIDLEEPGRAFEHGLFGDKAFLRRERSVDAGPGDEPSVVLTGDTGIGRLDDAAHGSRGERDCLRHSLSR